MVISESELNNEIELSLEKEDKEMEMIDNVTQENLIIENDLIEECLEEE